MILTTDVQAYLRRLHTSEDEILVEMYRQADRERIPVVVPETGAFLELLARTTDAKKAVEVGTAIGVSTLRLARGGTQIVSFEIDSQRHEAATEYISRAGLSDRVDLRLQDATDGVKELTGPFDLAFIDGPKSLYSGHIEAILPLLRSGGLLIIDNSLMSGGVATEQPTGPWDKEAIEEMRKLNRDLMSNPSLISAVTPVGDGVTLATKR